MSNLSGYDSEVVGFESVTRNKSSESDNGTQTSEFAEVGASSQTNLSVDSGCNVTPEDLNATESVLRQYPPPGLNEFLRRVVPAMMDQLNQNDKEIIDNSSDSDDEELVSAKLFQEIEVKTEHRLGSGDHQSPCVLSLSWSSAGNSLAVSIGYTHHENWCEHDGLIRIFTVKRTAGDKLVQALDITEKNCVSVVQYHPSVAALLAYATTSGEVVICNLRNSLDYHEGAQLTSPSGCHGSKRVSALLWADQSLANIFLTMQIKNTGKRRGAADQILFSSGSDGTINVWQVNSSSKVFENVVSYAVNGSRKLATPDITCFDFIKSYPLRPSDDKVADDVFVVGTKSGALYLCRAKSCRQIAGSNVLDPVYEVLEGHSTCILEVAFSLQRPGVFASVSIGSELKVYDMNQAAPLKVLCLDVPISSMCWLPNNPSVVVLGLAADPQRKHSLAVYNVCSGRTLPVDGFAGEGTVTSLSVNQSGSCRIAAGDSASIVRVWDLPSRKIRLSSEDLEF
ncbi:cytoplasmic dynein 2 intermediate chain 2-like [Galleria mellonella]|uniref:Cytoplasmic dynein 2 intermediate chain 2-like n=1 Tax=Galleria mellonella TaxID=7137 RepID=A0A6J1W9J4_GALME|nr:cytoplasmic dynein 2 intermediate chain 2-like [Galleria mellonella]